MLLLKFADAPADQIQNLSVHGTSFVLGNTVQLSVQFRFHLNAQMLVVFVPHRITSNILK